MVAAGQVIQLPTLLYVGLMQPEHLVLGLLAVLPLMGGMPLGAYILRQTTPDLFDKVIFFILVGGPLEEHGRWPEGNLFGHGTRGS